jgi:hypothetical protein
MMSKPSGPPGASVDQSLPRSCSTKGDCDRYGRSVLDAGDAASSMIAAWVRGRVPEVPSKPEDCNTHEQGSAADVDASLLALMDWPSSNVEDLDALAVYTLVFTSGVEERECCPVLMVHCLLNPIRVILLRLRRRPCGVVFDLDVDAVNVFGFELLYAWIYREASSVLDASSNSLTCDTLHLRRYDFDPNSWASLTLRGNAAESNKVWSRCGLRSSADSDSHHAAKLDRMLASLQTRHAAKAVPKPWVKHRLVRKTWIGKRKGKGRGKRRGKGRGKGIGKGKGSDEGNASQ